MSEGACTLAPSLSHSAHSSDCLRPVNASIFRYRWTLFTRRETKDSGMRCPWMVCDLRLAHFLPDLCHECFVELATKFGVLPMFA